VQAALAADPLRAAGAEPPQAAPLEAAGQMAFEGEAPAGAAVYLAHQLDPAWRIRGPDGTAAPPERAFGWSMLYRAPGGRFTVAFGRQWLRTLQLLLLAMLWLAAAWITRRSARAPAAGPP